MIISYKKEFAINQQKLILKQIKSFCFVIKEDKMLKNNKKEKHKTVGTLRERERGAPEGA